MFNTNEIMKIINETKDNTYTIKLLTKKSVKETVLGINLNALNKLLEITNQNYYYDIHKLAEYFKANKIGYTKLIRELGIPKATLSQMLNSGRNIKLATLNRIFDHYKISKDILRREK